jgi:suppressor of cytokine signaling 7
MEAARGNNSRIKTAISSIFKGSAKHSKDYHHNIHDERDKLQDTNQEVVFDRIEDTDVRGINQELEIQIDSEEDILNVDDERDVLNRSPFAHRALPPVPDDEDELHVHANQNSHSNSIENGSERVSGVSEEELVTIPTNLQLGSHRSPSSFASLSTCTSEEERRRARIMDYASSIEKVKDCGWYWGPVSGASAEKILSKEPEGSFIVRDSSNENYIFSLTVKLNGSVRHVRIEQDQGNFSFGCLHKFRCSTIVDFIEDAIEHSRSGRYLFFLHPDGSRSLEHNVDQPRDRDPMRVQLLHPLSRFKHLQSLQHLCRFVLLKHVRRDLIHTLPLPKRLKSYLNTPHYYSEDNSAGCS